MKYRAALIGGMFASLMLSTPHLAAAQQAGGFEQIPDEQSPVSFTSLLEGQRVFLRQYRENSTIFVGRWFAPRTANEPSQAASDLHLETVYTTSAPGFRFSTAMSPEQLPAMFDSLKGRNITNGPNFVQDTRYGQIAFAPFVRDGSQCASFVGQWDPQTQAQRGIRILGYYCTPVQIQSWGQPVPTDKVIDIVDAQEFAAIFMKSLTIELPENAAITDAVVARSGNAEVIQQPEGETTPVAIDGIDIVTNWQGVRGTGKLRFDQPTGEGTMIVDDAQRHCEGIWRHEGGAYQSGTLPFGSWYVYCNDASFARGHYTSESPTVVTGDGKDNQGQAVYFRQAN